MQSLTQARQKNTSAGEPIYCPVRGLNEKGTFFRRGQLTMIVAGPGSGKTALFHAILHHGNGNGLTNSAMFFSADSGPDVIWQRAASLSTGYTGEEVNQMLATGNHESLDQAVRTKSSHIKFDFTSSPSMEHILTEVGAYADIYGAYPEVIVMDNLKDLYVGLEDEFRSLEEGCMFLKDLARQTNAAVITLHHAGGAFEDGTVAIPMSGARGKVSKTPAVMVTISRIGEEMRLATVKNRTGKADATGKSYVPVRSDLGRMRFEG